MFDISWTEFLLIGVVALVVIGPKELPAVMRTLGQWTRKVRGMAAEFQNQFHEAMREAEMADLKKEVDDIARDIKNYDPLKDVRNDVEAIGKDLAAPVSLASTSGAAAAPAAASAAAPADAPPPAEESARLETAAEPRAAEIAAGSAAPEAVERVAIEPSIAPEAPPPAARDSEPGETGRAQ